MQFIVVVKIGVMIISFNNLGCVVKIQNFRFPLIVN